MSQLTAIRVILGQYGSRCLPEVNEKLLLESIAFLTWRGRLGCSTSMMIMSGKKGLLLGMNGSLSPIERRCNRPESLLLCLKNQLIVLRLKGGLVHELR